MWSIGAYSQYAYSEAPPIDDSNPLLERLAQALTADHILFLEVSARSNNVTQLNDVVPSRPGVIISGGVNIGYSANAYSALYMPHTTRETIRFLYSTRPWIGSATDPLRANQRAIPRLNTAGRITTRAPVDSNISKRGQRTIGDAVLSNIDGGLDHLLTDYTLTGGTVKAWIAEPSWSSDEWILLYEAQIGDADATRREIRISITTIADNLKRQLQTRRYGGGGGLSGDPGLRGRLRPTCWGECSGVDPVLIAEADNIYQVHDGRIQGVDYVAEGGLSYTFTADYGNISELQLATLASGEYATCLEYGLIRIGIALEGLVFPIRCGVKGDARGNGYVSSTGDILYRLARDRAFMPADQVDVESFRGLPRARVGYYTNGSANITVEKVFDDLLGGVYGTYGVGKGDQLVVARMIPADLQVDRVTVRGEQVFNNRVENRPYTPRVVQPYTFAPFFSPVDADQMSPVVDTTTFNTWTRPYQEGEYFAKTSAAVPLLAADALKTFFIEEAPAAAIAADALLFSTRNVVPVRLDIGRLGLLAEMGKVLRAERTRFAQDFRGTIYELETDLGAVVTTRAAAIG